MEAIDIYDIKMYAQKCKHYSGYSGQCFKQSESNKGMHINIRCSGKCERMDRFRIKHKVSKEAIEAAIKDLF